MTEELYTLHQTKMCFHCSEHGYVRVKTPDLFDYLERRKYAKDAFPYLTIGEVEQMISGTHPKCWDEMFPPNEDSIEDEKMKEQLREQSKQA
jgi:hypothetical protein